MSTPQPNAPKEPHLLSLKVLRAARPSLVHSPTPYYEAASLGGKALRELDLNSVGSGDAGDFGISGVLQLPSTFGTIYLGETFSALLSLSNDLTVLPSSSSIAISPVLKVEMHTTGTGAGGGLKHLLKPITPPGDAESLSPGDSVEGLVSHEVKELGVHALVCTVTYAVRVAGEAGQGLSPQSATTTSRSFRKVYKFQVSNPLSVRTKAHSPNPLTSTSSLSSAERNKVFLEVQIQNQGEHALFFERLNFEPVPSFTSSDINQLVPSPSSSSTESPSSLFSDTSSLLPPQAVRQYLYILSLVPSSPPALPGSSQPLGRLDIVWRTPHGEVGRLQTSMLGRRVPQPPAPIDLPSPAPTPIEKDAGPPTALPGSPARFAGGFEAPASPIRSPAPYRPSQLLASPNPGSPVRQPSPRLVTPLPPPLPPLFPDATGITFDLTVSSLSPTLIARETPFAITFALAITSSLPVRRTLKLVAQHVQYHPSPLAPPPPSAALPAAPRASIDTRPDPTFAGVVLPRPIPERVPQPLIPSREVVRIGSTITEIGLIEVEAGETVEREFGMRFLAVASGLFRVGGVRVLLVENLGEEEGEGGRERRARVVWESGVVAEVWVRSAHEGREQ